MRPCRKWQTSIEGFMVVVNKIGRSTSKLKNKKSWLERIKDEHRLKRRANGIWLEKSGKTQKSCEQDSVNAEYALDISRRLHRDTQVLLSVQMVQS